MNTRNILQATFAASLLAVAAAGAQAAPMGEGDTLSARPASVQSTRSFAGQQAGNMVRRNGQTANFNEGYGEGAHVAGSRAVDRQAVRAEAIHAERAGEIERGDAMSY